MERRYLVLVCSGPTCGERRGSQELMARMRSALAARGLEDSVSLEAKGCFGHCHRGPNVLVCPVEDDDAPAGAGLPAGDVLYSRMRPEDVDRVVERHLHRGQVIWAFVGRPEWRDD
jgi:(2Fe-2S) ferredoxin